MYAAIMIIRLQILELEAGAQRMTATKFGGLSQGLALALLVVATASAHAADEKAGADADGLGDVFGFATPTDTLGNGEREFAQELVGRSGRTGGAYRALDGKTQLGFGIVDGFSITPGLLSTWAKIDSIAGAQDHEGFSFNGAVVELKWMVLDRARNGIGLALLSEPGVSWTDGETGDSVRGRGAEFRVAADWAMAPGKLFANVNLAYGLERTKADGVTEDGSELLASGAVAYRLSDRLFVGAELRYIRAYDGLGLDDRLGEALYLGPTLFWQPTEKIAVTMTWSPQVWGRDKADPGSSLDLANFERHQGKLKVAIPF